MSQKLLRENIKVISTKGSNRTLVGLTVLSVVLRITLLVSAGGICSVSYVVMQIALPLIARGNPSGMLGLNYVLHK